MDSKFKLKLLARLNGRSKVDAFEAAKQVWSDPNPSLVRPFIAILQHGRNPFNRSAAAHALPVLRDRKAIPVLERVVSNASESPKVRGEAAEALAHFHRKRSHRVLVNGLADSSKDVRFWCAFALGEMGDASAIPAPKPCCKRPTDRERVVGSEQGSSRSGPIYRTGATTTVPLLCAGSASTLSRQPSMRQANATKSL
jgi:HEAT repeat protein